VWTAVLVLLGGCALPNCSPKTTTGSSTPATTPSASASSPTATASPSAAATPSEAPSPTPSPSPPPLVITRQSLPLHIGEVAIAYTPATLGAGGGTPPYTWSIGGGALPAGLSLSSGGSISGTPTAAGTANFALLLKDSAGVAAGCAASINILPALTATGLCTKQCSVEMGCLTVCGGFGGVSGGVQPYVFSLTQGSLPTGMTLSGLALTGAFPVTTSSPTAAAGPVLYSFTVGVTDALGAASSVNAAFGAYPHIAMQGGTIGVSPQALCFWTGAPSDPGCTVQFPYIQGTPNAGTIKAAAAWTTYTCAVAPPLPTVTAANGQVTVAVPSGGSTCNGWSGTLSVVLTNQDPCAPGPVYCSSTAALIDITQQAS